EDGIRDFHVTGVQTCALPIYKQHCDLDLTKIFPANDSRDPKLVDSWNWDLYVKTAEQLHKAGFPVGLPMGQTSDAIDWVGALFQIGRASCRERVWVVGAVA